MSLERIESKIDGLDRRLDNVDVHLAVYNKSLDEHIKRTDLLETLVKDHDKHVLLVEKVSGWALKIVTSSAFLSVCAKLLHII